jgi:hypothetical protein
MCNFFPYKSVLCLSQSPFFENPPAEISEASGMNIFRDRIFVLREKLACADLGAIAPKFLSL